VVLRSANVERAARFYGVLGLTFMKHRHGSGPEHYACESPDGFVFELYPSKTDAGTTATRIGFRVPDVNTAVAALEGAGAVVVSAPADSPWGRRAVVADPDGHRVELTEPLTGEMP
jgi:hypothetical protein